MYGMGYYVGGDFDLGSKQRPKIKGVTDRNHNVDDFDTIVLHQVPNYCKVMEQYLKEGKNVILVSFGQIDTWQYDELARICRENPSGWIAAYSTKDYNGHLNAGTPGHKVRLIRFGKYLTDFKPWEGNGGFIYASCNNIQDRGNGCGWEHMKKCMDHLPIRISGKGTDKLKGGLGEITVDAMNKNRREAAGFLSFGTMPATFVMTQMEAWCAGTPTLIWDNGFGISGEGLDGILTSNVDQLIEEGKRLLKDEGYRQARHRDSLHNAELFDVTEVGMQWSKLIMEAQR